MNYRAYEGSRRTGKTTSAYSGMQPPYVIRRRQHASPYSRPHAVKLHEAGGSPYVPPYSYSHSPGGQDSCTSGWVLLCLAFPPGFVPSCIQFFQVPVLLLLGMSIRIADAKRLLIVNYGIASMKNNLDDINGWLYHRIRMCIWKQWKLPRTRRRNLIKLGIPEYYAHMAANSRKGYWRTSNTTTVKRALTKERLINSGFYDLANAYQSLHVNY